MDPNAPTVTRERQQLDLLIWELSAAVAALERISKIAQETLDKLEKASRK
jgi:hypothetical protein